MFVHTAIKACGPCVQVNKMHTQRIKVVSKQSVALNELQLPQRYAIAKQNKTKHKLIVDCRIIARDTAD